MIDVTASAKEYAIKTCHLINGLKSVRLVVPKKWKYEYVNIMLWEEDISSLSFDGDEYSFDIPQCGEVLLRKVIFGDRNHINIPRWYDKQKVLIIPA